MVPAVPQVLAQMPVLLPREGLQEQGLQEPERLRLQGSVSLLVLQGLLPLRAQGLLLPLALLS